MAFRRSTVRSRSAPPTEIPRFAAYSSPRIGMRIGVTLDDRVGNVADTVGNAARVFEILSIDYCCKRDRTLRDAAAAANLDASELLELLDSTAAAPPSHAPADAAKTPLHELTRFVSTTHHKRARSMLV